MFLFDNSKTTNLFASNTNSNHTGINFSNNSTGSLFSGNKMDTNANKPVAVSFMSNSNNNKTNLFATPQTNT